MTKNGELSAAQKRAIAALLTERNNRDAAKAARVAERTLWRWMNDDPIFQAELSRQESAIIDHATRRLLALQDTALDVFTDVFTRMDQHEKADLSQFFKASERWTEEPLPTEEIIREEEFTKIINNKAVKCKRYLVKKIALDLDALLDPERSQFVRKFTDSPKNGLGIDLHDVQGAAGLKLRAAISVLDYMMRLRELNSTEARLTRLERNVEARNDNGF